MSVRFAGISPVFIVEKVAPTRSFFADRLGFDVISDVEHDGVLAFSMLQRGSVTLMVQSDASLRADFGENYVAGPYKAEVYVEIDDVEAFVPEIADADVILPLRRTPYGMHEVGVREPGGNIVIFASRLAP